MNIPADCNATVAVAARAEVIKRLYIGLIYGPTL